MKEVHLHFSNTELQLNSERKALLDLQLDCAEWPQQHKVPWTCQCAAQAREHVYMFMLGSVPKSTICIPQGDVRSYYSHCYKQKLS